MFHVHPILWRALVTLAALAMLVLSAACPTGYGG